MSEKSAGQISLLTFGLGFSLSVAHSQTLLSRATKSRSISLTSSRSFFGSCSMAARSQRDIHVSPIRSFSFKAILSSGRIGSI
jgi:hypothetical protein